ncbi:amidohydrolase family protein [Neobittarella massiliensis]|uniref:Amidohydrolase family protein n=1 Tax=Neobittarella massiliensis (ex Bilen et al. 2018) TaxID=2041842 RepID=A0A8J6IIZ9_9FIRM|nr:amidohydrolase family protein [Neobittarella massiliensis]MBC3515351.1 amidohydrolase family protein [Neobittarella massiliensis]
MDKIVLLCGKLFCSTTGTVKEKVAVTVEGEKITAVCPVEQADTAGCTVYDLGDKFVTPGLIDAHVHTIWDGEVEFMDCINKGTIGDLTIRSMLLAKKDLMAGFTTIRDEGSYGFADIAVRNAIDRGEIDGPRMFVSGEAISSTGGHSDGWLAPQITGKCQSGVIIDGPDAGRRAARYNLKYGADQIKIMATGGVGNPGEPGAIELTFEEMKAILDVANSRGRISSAHAHGAQGIKNAIRAGITSIEHGMLMDDECVELMARHGTYLVPTIIAGQRINENGVAAGLPAEVVEKSVRCLQGHRENLRKCRQAGVKICFGTDAGTSFNYHGKQAYEFSLMVDFGFTVAQVLQAATATNAQLLGWQDKVGSVEPGKLADIAAFDGDPFADISSMQRCSFVMKGGKVYKA